MKYIVTTQKLADGDVYIELPPELLQETGWDENTELVWVEQDNKIILRKINDSGN